MKDKYIIAAAIVLSFTVMWIGIFWDMARTGRLDNPNATHLTLPFGAKP